MLCTHTVAEDEAESRARFIELTKVHGCGLKVNLLACFVSLLEKASLVKILDHSQLIRFSHKR